MTIDVWMKEKKISRYRLSKNTNIPYTTLTDIISGKARLEKCSAETVYKLARELQVPMEELLAPHLESRCSFELFKSNVCHQLKEQGDIDFIITTLEENKIRSYYERQWYPECLYLLAMLDYVSRINKVPLCGDYDDLRGLALPERLYPAGILALASVEDSDSIKQKAWAEALPEFKRFNIIENEVRRIA